MPSPTSSLKQAVRAYFVGIDDNDLDAVDALVHQDIVMIFANAEPSIGKRIFMANAKVRNPAFAQIRHDLIEVWQPDDGAVVIVTMTVTYERLDGFVVAVPCCGIFEFDGGQIRRYRVFIDRAPAVAATAAQA